MTIVLIVTGVAVFAALAVLIALLMRQQGSAAAARDTLRYATEQGAALKATSETLALELRQFKEGGFDALVREKLQALHQEATSRDKLLSDQQSKATAALSGFHEKVGQIASQIESLGELHTKVGQLNDLLKPQQLRGELGEVIVRTLIADKLPPGQFEEDYGFADGKRVEFAIRLSEKLIPVDSKLQLDAYKRMRDAADERQRQTCRTEFKREVKRKVDEVSQYIRPEEGTHNFALMVIPSEAVYYDLIGHKDFLDESGLYDYARAHNVFIVSPLTFWAYLIAIAHGLRGLEIGRRAEEILSGLQTLSGKIRDLARDEFNVLGTHLKNARNQYDEAQRKLQEIDEHLRSLERLQSNPLPAQLALQKEPQ